MDVMSSGWGSSVIPKRLTSGGIFNNGLLFKNNRLLFSKNFCQGSNSDGGGQSRERGDPPLGKTLGSGDNVHLMSWD